MPSSLLGGAFLIALAVLLFLFSYILRLYLKKSETPKPPKEDINPPEEQKPQKKKYVNSVITENDVGKRVYIVRKK